MIHSSYRKNIVNRKWVRRWVLLLLIITIVIITWGLFTPKEDIQYLTDTVKKSNIEQTVNATGELAPEQLVDVGAQASGQIKKLHVKLGQHIRQGDLIAEIDATSQRNTLKTNQARLQSYRAQLAAAKLKLQHAQSQLTREESLWSKNATAKIELENAQDAVATAKANIAEIESSIQQTKIAINTAELDLSYTRITAPSDGTVVAIPVEEGQTVNAVQSAPRIIQIAKLDNMLNKMQISESDITKVKPGMKLSFTTLSDSSTPIEATLDSIDPGFTSVSQGSYSLGNDNGTAAIYYYARSLVPNPDGQLYIGMTTQNTIVIQVANQVLTVSNQSISNKKGRQTVRILKPDHSIQEVEIKTGLSDGVRTEIKQGLKEGDEVIIGESKAQNNQPNLMSGPRR